MDIIKVEKHRERKHNINKQEEGIIMRYVKKQNNKNRIRGEEEITKKDNLMEKREVEIEKTKNEA